MDLWKHGRYADFWSVVHLLSGALLALSCYALGYGFWFAAGISFAFLAALEFFEWIIGIIEPSPNVAVDILLGVVGFLFAAYWQYFLQNSFNIQAFIVCLVSTLCLSAWGFLDFYFRGYR